MFSDKKPAPKASKPKVGFFGAVKTAPKSVPAEKSKSDSSKKKKDEAIHIDATPKEQASSVVSAEEMSEEEVKVVKKPAPVKKAVIKNPIKDAKRSAQETQLMDMFNDDEDMVRVLMSMSVSLVF